MLGAYGGAGGWKTNTWRRSQVERRVGRMKEHRGRTWTRTSTCPGLRRWDMYEKLCVVHRLSIHLFLCLSHHWHVHFTNTYSFVHPTVYPFICPFVHPAVCLPFHLSVFPSIHLSNHLFVHPSVHLFVHPSICQFNCPFVHTSVHLTIHPFICPSVCFSIHPSIHTYYHQSMCPYVQCPTMDNNLSIYRLIFLSICLYF